MLSNQPNYKCMLIGCIGKDSYGTEIIKGLESAGAFPLLEVIDTIKSTRCAVAIHLKERCLMPQIRASSFLSQKFIDNNLDMILNASILLIEGYILCNKFELIQNLVSQFLKANKKVVLTLSATVMVVNFKNKFIEIANQSHLIFCNHEEALAFAGVESENYDEVSLTIHKMLDPFDRLLIITRAENPVVISKYDFQQNKMDFIMYSEVYSVKSENIVDTAGCGDSFVGGFISQYIQGKSLEKCARAGNWASSIILQNVGCSYPQNLIIPEF